MGRRLDLHEELAQLAGSSFSIYFQPPNGTKINYPCIVYNFETADSLYADNGTYRYTKRYQITVITRDPDCELPHEIVRHFPMCRMDRAFVRDNLHHTDIVLYY